MKNTSYDAKHPPMVLSPVQDAAAWGKNARSTARTRGSTRERRFLSTKAMNFVSDIGYQKNRRAGETGATAPVFGRVGQANPTRIAGTNPRVCVRGGIVFSPEFPAVLS